VLAGQPAAIAQQRPHVLDVSAPVSAHAGTRPVTRPGSLFLLAAGEGDDLQGELSPSEATPDSNAVDKSNQTEEDAKEKRKAEILTLMRSLRCRGDFLGKFSEDDLPLLYELLKDPVNSPKGHALATAICSTTPRKESLDAIANFIARDDGWTPRSYDSALRKVVCIFPTCYLGPELALDYLCSAVTDQGARKIVSAWAPNIPAGAISEESTIIFARKYAAAALAYLQTPEAFNALKKEYDLLRLSASGNEYDEQALYVIIEGLTEFEAIKALGIDEFERIRDCGGFESWRKIEHFGDKYPAEGDLQETIEPPVEKSKPTEENGEKDQ
jgi:hypothetical protein